MNRDFWQQKFTLNVHPAWPCTACEGGRLLAERNTLYKVEINESGVMRQHPDWEPSWNYGYFVCQFRCIDCSEVHIMSGDYSIREWSNCLIEDSPIEYTDEYEPKFFMKAPPIINLPRGLPLNIYKEMQRSFHLYWVDHPACANSIRTSIELLLTHQKINRVEITQNKKRRNLSLHSRIELFREKHKDLADSLLAVKWIGNAGSHPEQLNRDDILDSYEIIEHVFDQLFEQKAKHIAELSRQINYRRKPRSAR